MSEGTVRRTEAKNFIQFYACWKFVELPLHANSICCEAFKREESAKNLNVMMSGLERENVVQNVLDEVIAGAFNKIHEKTMKLNYVSIYQDALKEALTEILSVYEMLKPTTDHSHIIEAWKRDKPAKPSPPDCLIRNFI